MFELFLGIRYLKAKRKQAFISVITVISALGVMVGVMSLVVVLSVMNGFRADLITKILGVNSHVMVLKYGSTFDDYQQVSEHISSLNGIVASTPFINAQAMFNHGGNISASYLWGINPDSAVRVVNIGDVITEGSLESLTTGGEGPLPPIIIGKELARQTHTDLGDVISLMSPEGKLTPMGRVPNSREFKVTGIFESGFYEYDATMVYVTLQEAQDFLAYGDRVTGLAVKADDVFKADVIAEDIQNALGLPYRTRDWKAMNKNLFSALELEKYTMFVILAMIVLVGALNIISTLVMVVMEKTRDVAILRAMGSSAKSIMAIFMLQGLLVGLVGTVLGLASGLGICWLLDTYKFINLDPSVYYIHTLPVQVETMDILFVSIAAVIISFAATIYPSWYASRLNPAEAIRYE